MSQGNKKYYSQRKNPDASVSLEMLKQIYLDYYREIDDQGFLDEWIGLEDDWGNRSGGSIENPHSYVLRKLRKELWPIHACIDGYSEDDLLTIIEFVHDHISIASAKSQSGYDTELAQKIYREDLNPILADFGVGLELSKDGEITLIEPIGMEYLLSANVPTPKTVDVELISTIEKCVSRFRARKSSIEDRQGLIVELVGVFEALKKSQLLSPVLNDKDESAVFEFANKFAIRHRDPLQIKNYDKDIWLSWAFYYYLATIHAVLRLIQRQEMLKPGDNDLWTQVLQEVKRQNSTLYGILRLGKPIVHPNKVELSFQFLFHARRVQEEKNKQIIQKAMQGIFEKQMDLVVKVANTTSQLRSNVA